jgi:hypothetical protein
MHLFVTLLENGVIARTLLEKVEIPTEFRDGIYFFSNRDEIRDKKAVRDKYIYFRDRYFHFRDRFCPSLII